MSEIKLTPKEYELLYMVYLSSNSLVCSKIEGLGEVGDRIKKAREESLIDHIKDYEEYIKEQNGDIRDESRF